MFDTESRQRARPARRRWWQFIRREDGGATIDFILIFPAMFVVFVSTVDVGLLMVRQVMLDRGVDITVRALRLGQLEPNGPDDSIHELLKRNVCSIAGLLPKCMDNILIELQPIDTATWTPLAATPTCIDADADVQPVTNPNFGQQNEMMLVRVCAMLKPMFTTSSIGMQLTRDGDYFGIVSTSAFVNEPTS